MAIRNTKLTGSTTNFTTEHPTYQDINDTNSAIINESRNILSFTADDTFAAGDFGYGVGVDSDYKIKKMYTTPTKTNLTTGNTTTSPASGSSKVVMLTSTLGVHASNAAGTVYLQAFTLDASGNVTAMGTEVNAGAILLSGKPIEIGKLSSSSFFLVTCVSTATATVVIRHYSISGTTITTNATGNVTTTRITTGTYGWICAARVSDNTVIAGHNNSGNYYLTICTWGGSSWTINTAANVASVGDWDTNPCQIKMINATKGLIAFTPTNGATTGYIGVISISGTTPSIPTAIGGSNDNYTVGFGWFVTSDSDYYAVRIQNNGTFSLYDITSTVVTLQSTTITPVPAIGHYNWCDTANSNEKLAVWYSAGDIYMQKLSLTKKKINFSAVFSDTGWNESTNTNMGADYVTSNIFVATGNADLTAVVRPFNLTSFAGSQYPTHIATATITSGNSGEFQLPYSISNNHSGLKTGGEYTMTSNALAPISSSTDIRYGLAVSSTKLMFYKTWS